MKAWYPAVTPGIHRGSIGALQIRVIISPQDCDHSTQRTPAVCVSRCRRVIASFPAVGEFGDETDDRVVEIESAGFPKPGDGHRDDRLARRKPHQDGIGRHFDAGPGFADRRHPPASCPSGRHKSVPRCGNRGLARLRWRRRFGEVGLESGHSSNNKEKSEISNLNDRSGPARLRGGAGCEVRRHAETSVIP